MQGPCLTQVEGATLSGRTIRSAASRHPGRLAGRAPVMLFEDQFHGALEHRSRRTGSRREPFVELAFLDTEETCKPVAPALQVLALLENARAHLRPSWLLDHGAAASKMRSITAP